MPTPTLFTPVSAPVSTQPPANQVSCDSRTWENAVKQCEGVKHSHDLLSALTSPQERFESCIVAKSRPATEQCLTGKTR